MTKILLTGGGTGGHIYPLLAVGQDILKITNGNVEIVYMGPKSPINVEFENYGIRVYQIVSSKWRRYFSVQNILDIPKFFWGILQALFKLYFLMPSVVFSKGGPGALPVVLAARFYFIPVIIHESDAIPGLTNRLSAKFAKRIAIAWKGAAKYFPIKKTALVGNPIRPRLLDSELDGRAAKERLGFSGDLPLILIWGGSQGAMKINALVMDNLEKLISEFQIFHQAGPNNFKEVSSTVQGVLRELSESSRKKYKLVDYLDASDLSLALNAADVIISRAGASSISEIAAFGKPSILVPLDSAANDHQGANAYEYAETGAAVVIEEENFTINIVLDQIKNILGSEERMRMMREAAKNFSKPNAARVIAEEILRLAAK